MAGRQTSSEWAVIREWRQQQQQAPESRGRFAVCGLCRAELKVAGVGGFRGLVSAASVDTLRAATTLEDGPEMGLLLACGHVCGHRCMGALRARARVGGGSENEVDVRADEGQENDGVEACPVCGMMLRFLLCRHVIPPAPLPLVGSQRRDLGLFLPPTAERREDLPDRCRACRQVEALRREAVIERMYKYDVYEPNIAADEVTCRGLQPQAQAVAGEQPQWGDADAYAVVPYGAMLSWIGRR